MIYNCSPNTLRTVDEVKEILNMHMNCVFNTIFSVESIETFWYITLYIKVPQHRNNLIFHCKNINTINGINFNS